MRTRYKLVLAVLGVLILLSGVIVRHAHAGYGHRIINEPTVVPSPSVPTDDNNTVNVLNNTATTGLGELPAVSQQHILTSKQLIIQLPQIIVKLPNSNSTTTTTQTVSPSLNAFVTHGPRTVVVLRPGSVGTTTALSQPLLRSQTSTLQAPTVTQQQAIIAFPTHDAVGNLPCPNGSHGEVFATSAGSPVTICSHGSVNSELSSSSSSSDDETHEEYHHSGCHEHCGGGDSSHDSDDDHTSGSGSDENNDGHTSSYGYNGGHY